MTQPFAKLFASSLILGLCATYGCSGDDDDTTGTGAHSSGAKGGKGGTAGRGGSGGRGGTAGIGGSLVLGGTGGRGGNGGTVFGGTGGTSGRGGTAGLGGTSGLGGTAGTTLGGEGGNGDIGGQAGGGGESGEAALRLRGEYLVDHVAACGDCHTPRNSDGTPDMTRYLAGNATFVDLVPEDDAIGLIPSRNLTPDASGLRDWTNAEIKAAFLNGVDDEGEPLYPIMPYYVFHNMSSEDADAIVAYLRSVPAVHSNLPERQPLPTPLTAPASPVAASAIPETTLATSSSNYERAQNGRYLAGMIGTCMECHTAEAAPSSAIPIDVDRLFAGGRVFEAAALGLPVPPYPAQIETPNLTPDGTGIATLSVDDITRAIRQGIDHDGTRLCPPMPAGPMMAFGGMTLDDATDIAIYLKSIPPVVNAGIAECTPPDEGGGGASGAGGNGG